MGPSEYPFLFSAAISTSLGKDYSFSTSCFISHFSYPLMGTWPCSPAIILGTVPSPALPSPTLQVSLFPFAFGQPSRLQPLAFPPACIPASATTLFPTQTTAPRTCPWKCSWILLFYLRRVNWEFLPHF